MVTELPRQPVLLPGLRLVRRDADHLQLGVDPPRRAILPDLPDVRRLVDDLAAGSPTGPLGPDAARVLDDLARAGMVVEAPTPRDGTSPAAAAAALVQHGPAARERLARRQEARIFLEAPTKRAGAVRSLLAGSGCAPTAASEHGADVVLLVADFEIGRERLDSCAREERPHLVVRVGGGRPVVGPFVVPGVTACLRCLDAHRAESDPRRSLVLEQVADARPCGVEPDDAMLSGLALAWAVRDVVTFVEGDRPATWSTTVEVDAALTLPRRRWLRHPHCGCSWGAGLAVG